MKTLATFASSAILAVAASTASAAVVDVTYSLNATITGAGTGSQTGTGVGTYDTATQLLTLTTTYSVSNSGLISGSMDQTGQTLVDFSTLTGSNEVLTCNKTSGLFDLCSFVPSGPQPISVTGTWDSFVAVSTFSGATTTQNWAVTSVSPIPVPAAAWLFGSAVMGLVGIGRRRKA